MSERSGRVLLILLAVITWRARNSAADNWKPPNRGDVRLMVKIERQKFCSGDSETYTAALDLNTTYLNVSSSALTIFLGTDVPSQILISRSLNDLRRGNYETRLDLESYPMNGGQYMLGSNPKKERRVRLAPHQSTNGYTSIGVVIRKLASVQIPGTIPEGTHYMQVLMNVKVSPTNRPSHRKSSAQYRWIPVKSQPIRFRVPANPALKTCSE